MASLGVIKMLYNDMLDIKKIESVYHKVKCNTKHK